MMDRLLDLDGRPAPEANSEMTERELRQDNEFLRDMIRDLQRQLEEANQANRRNSEQLDRLYKLVESSQAEQKRLLSIIERLQTQLAVGKKMHFGSKSVKGIDRKPESRGKDDDKDDFDGTPGSLTVSVQEESESKPCRKSKGNSSKGSTYKTLEADARVEHKSDMSQLPEGAIKIKTEIRKVFDQISLIIEHDFELVTYRTKEGKVETSYFPYAEDRQYHIYNEVVPGTHITAGMLSHLAFDCHQMSTPVNRELTRFTDLSLKTCRQTLINWLWKG